ncbi:septum formation family protein [Streptomyces sp. NPDC090741]|uniref:septum formation family protein n=1 Tax=Streptomyces sp. NPDC090741 TaxID=3365967 RepID=UPI0037FE8297
MSTPPPPHSPPPPARQAYGERGKALAITGLVVSLAMTAALILVTDRVGERLFDRLDTLEQYQDVEGELTAMDDMRAGDCFNVPGGDLLAERPFIYKTACTEPHEGEVTSSTRLAGGPFPGDPELRRTSVDACWKAQDAYAMDSWALPSYAEMFYFVPSHESWGGGDRRRLCVIGTAEQEHRGSLRKDATMLTPEQVAFLRVMNETDLVLGGEPEEEIDEALPRYREWAGAVDRALGVEAGLLDGVRERPELAGPAGAQLKEVEAARAGWRRAARATKPAEFQAAWDEASAAPSVDTEKALRGAYGLATTVPEWLAGQSDGSDGDLEDSDEGSAGGSAGDSDGASASAVRGTSRIA